MTVKITPAMMKIVEDFIYCEKNRPGNEGISDKVALKKAYENYFRTVS